MKLQFETNGLRFYDSQEVFQWAIDEGHFTTKDPNDSWYPGKWMYMSSRVMDWPKGQIIHDFKNIEYRNHIGLGERIG